MVVLGTGWAATSFLKDLDISSYDVQVISPRNYFAFTPLLPSVTYGTVEARSIVEPVRKIIKKVNHTLKVVNSFVRIFLISRNIAVRMYWLPIFSYFMLVFEVEIGILSHVLYSNITWNFYFNLALLFSLHF